MISVLVSNYGDNVWREMRKVRETLDQEMDSRFYGKTGGYMLIYRRKDKNTTREVCGTEDLHGQSTGKGKT